MTQAGIRSWPHAPLAHANLQDTRSWGCLCQQQGHITRKRAGFILLQEPVEEMGAGRVANTDVSRAAVPGGRAEPIHTIPSLTLPGAVECPDPPAMPWTGYPGQPKGTGVVQLQYHRAPEHWECMSVTLPDSHQHKWCCWMVQPHPRCCGRL